MKIKREILVLFLGVVMLIPLTCTGGFAETDVGKFYTLDGYVQAGGGWLSSSPRFMNRSYLTQYVPFPQGFLAYTDLTLKSKDGLDYYRFYMYQPGLRDQNFLLQVGKLGLYHAEVEYNELQHIYCRVNPLDPNIMIHVYNLRASGWFNLTPDITVFAENDFWRRTGSQPASYVTGPGTPYNYVARNLRPIDYKQNDLKAGAEYDRPQGQFRVYYHFSVFDDGNQLMIGNPTGVVTTKGSPILGSYNTLVSLPPGNVANYICAEGGFNIPDYKTRITGSLTYGWLTQNNTVFDDTHIDQGQAGLGATTLAAYISGVSRPIDELSIRYSYRAYNYQQDNNVANTVVDRAFGVNAAIPNTALLRAEQYSYLSQMVNFGADYKVNSQLAVTAGYTWKGFNRTQGQGTTSTNTPSVGARWCPVDWLNLIANYSYSARRGTNYLVGIPQPGEPTNQLLPITYKYYAGTNSRNTINFIAEATPVNNLTCSVNCSFYNDNYKNNNFGLVSDSAWSAGADVSWRPIERVALSLGYDYQSIKTRTTAIDSLKFFPTTAGVVTSAFIAGDSGYMLWTSDHYHTFTLKGDFKLIPDRLNFTTSGNYSFSNSNFQNQNVPNLNTSILYWNSFFTFQFNEHWACQLGYIFEWFKQSSAYQTLYTRGITNVGVLSSNQGLNTLAGYYPNSTAHIVQAFLRYKF